MRILVLLFIPLLLCAPVVSVVTFTAPVSPQLYKVLVRNVTRRDTYFISVKKAARRGTEMDYKTEKPSVVKHHRSVQLLWLRVPHLCLFALYSTLSKWLSGDVPLLIGEKKQLLFYLLILISLTDFDH